MRTTSNESFSSAAAAPSPPAAGAPAAALRDAVREIEAYAAEAGWDQPARLFALVPTTDLLQREPGLAEALGVDDDTAAEAEPADGDETTEE